MGILVECEEKIKNLNKYKFDSRFKPRVRNPQKCVGSYFLFKGSKRNHHLAQRCGPNGEYNIIATIQSLSTLATMVDILCDILFDKERDLDFELSRQQGSHNTDVERKAHDLMVLTHQELMQDYNSMKLQLAQIKDKYSLLKAERAKMKAYVRRHFKI